MSMNLYATIGVGLENLVSRELAALGVSVQRVEPGRVRFEGSHEQLYVCLVNLRCVSRVVRELAFEEIEHEDDIYEAARDLDWPAYFGVDKTFRVTFNAHSSLVRNSRYQTYRVKDAVCDCFVQRCGRRPDVDTRQARVHVYCYLENRRLSIGLDGAGEPLHMRGYRTGQHVASIREHLAAAMVLHSGWQPPAPLHDPFCGSGTIPIEAALIATRTPPSLWRSQFGCEGWTEFEPDVLARVRSQAAEQRVAGAGVQITGADADPAAIELARRNVQAAGMQDVISLRCEPVARMPAVCDGTVIANPPYGVRLADSGVLEAWQGLREAALRCTGSTVMVLQSSEEFEKVMSLRPFKKNRMNNGALPCTLYQYRIRGPLPVVRPPE